MAKWGNGTMSKPCPYDMVRSRMSWRSLVVIQIDKRKTEVTEKHRQEETPMVGALNYGTNNDKTTMPERKIKDC